MAMLLIRNFLICVFATAFYSLLMVAPRRSILPAALIAAAGYTVYEVIFTGFGYELAGYFAGTLVIAVAGELLARRMKTPSLIFVFPAIIPLVPGIGIYSTMLLLVQEDFSGAVRKGVGTVFIAGAMAVAIALTNMFARSFFTRKKPPERENQQSLK